MIDNLFKRNIVGVSITLGLGIEVAQVDYEKQAIINYGMKPIAIDNRFGFPDLDLFKDALRDLFNELGIQKGADVILSIPTAKFGIKDWPAAIANEQIQTNLEDELSELEYFQNRQDSPLIDFKKVEPMSTIQMNKIVYAAAPMSTITEIALMIEELGHTLVGIDSSVNTTLNALYYSGRIDINDNTNWVLLLVDETNCKVVSMQGLNYVDIKEEPIGIGRVLGDDENYSTVYSAVYPVLQKTPSELLYVVSKTDIISAKNLADMIEYNAPIVHQEINLFNNVPLLTTDLSDEFAIRISSDVIGAAIKKDFKISTCPLNLFNKNLGEIYENQAVPVVGGVELNSRNSTIIGAIILVALVAISVLCKCSFDASTKSNKLQQENLNANITRIESFLEEKKDIMSASQFSEPDQIRLGLAQDTNINEYYQIVGEEIPEKLWLTYLSLGEHITIKGQAENLESVYSFYRNLKDFQNESNIKIKLQKLGLARDPNRILDQDFDTESVLTSLNADFYEFVISDIAPQDDKKEQKISKNNSGIPADLPPIDN